jgi:potassium channel subfamily K, other eukaryote
LIANLALLFNMARRISFSIAQPITIIGWYISSFLLIGLLIAAKDVPSFQIPPEKDPALTQAFYYAILAASLYFVIASLMCVTVYGAWAGHYPNAFKLTLSQRTLMIQTISYLVYLLAGGAIFARIEDWLFLNGVYWANVTLLTIGLGDFSPTTHLGQGLLFPYAIGGVVHLGLVIGSIRSLVLERGKKKLEVRMVEKKREKIIKQLDSNDGVVRVSPFVRKRNLNPGIKPELERRKAEFEVMRMIQDHASTMRKWYSLMISLLAWCFLWFIGAVVFWVAERGQQGLTYFEALYMTYVSLLTIGYGDYTPVSNASKAFFVFWSLLVVPTLTILISNMGDTVVKAIKDVTMYVSEFTVLPGESSAKARLKNVVNNIAPRQIFRDNSNPFEETPGGAYMPEQDRDPERGQEGSAKTFRKVVDRLGRDFQEEELQGIEEAHREGDKLKEDRHLHHYMLVKAIRRVMKDVGSQPAKKYSYRDWSWFLRLLGEDEGDDMYHRRPPVDPSVDMAKGQPTVGGGRDDPNNRQGTVQWSWVGTRSPLMGDLDEPEWLLERLTERLEEFLEVEHRQNGRDHNEKQAGTDAERLQSLGDATTVDSNTGEAQPSSTTGEKVSQG